MSSLADILTYDRTCFTGADCLINYLAVLLSGALLIADCLHTFDEGRRARRAAFVRASIAFLFFVVFQLVLCLFVVECVGISIVWNSNLGYASTQRSGLLDRLIQRFDSFRVRSPG